MNAALSPPLPPPTDRAARQTQVVHALLAVLPAHALLWQNEDTTPYECDGLTAYRERPMVVALPETYAQVQAVLKACHALDVPVVARGAGTGLSGGAMPHRLGVTLSLAKFNKILSMDPASRTAVVQGGVRNLAISDAAAPHGLYYAPDPSSQIACTIGGNVAENSGGVHCLKYGLTVHNVLKVRGFTIEGDEVEFGSDALDDAGYDLLAIVIGSEGKLAAWSSTWCSSGRPARRCNTLGVRLFMRVPLPAAMMTISIGFAMGCPRGIELRRIIQPTRARSDSRHGPPLSAWTGCWPHETPTPHSSPGRGGSRHRCGTAA